MPFAQAVCFTTAVPSLSSEVAVTKSLGSMGKVVRRSSAPGIGSISLVVFNPKVVSLCTSQVGIGGGVLTVKQNKDTHQYRKNVMICR